MPLSKAVVLARISDEQAHWRDLVAEVGRERMDQPGPMGAWTFRDLTAHLLGWRNRTLARLQAAAQGRPAPAAPWPSTLEDDDAINAWIRDHDANRSTDEVLADYDASFDRLSALVRALPGDDLDDATLSRWFGGSTADPPGIGVLFAHLHDEHEPAVRSWLART